MLPEQAPTLSQIQIHTLKSNNISRKVQHWIKSLQNILGQISKEINLINTGKLHLQK